MTSSEHSSPAAEQPQSLAQRGNNRSRQPQNEAFRDFIGSGWGPRPSGLPERNASAPWAAARREALGARFPGERLVLPAGPLKTRNNDCDYRFRPHSAFAHLAGTGTDFEPDAVLVLEPLTAPGEPVAEGHPTHEGVLYFRPRASRSSEEFYGNPRYGELWVGVRPSAEEVEAATGIRVAHVDTLGAQVKQVKANGRLELVAIGHWSSRFAEGARALYVSVGTPGLKALVALRRANGVRPIHVVVTDEGIGTYGSWTTRRDAIRRQGAAPVTATLKACLIAA